MTVAYHVETWTGRELPFVVFKLLKIGKWWPFTQEVRSFVGWYNTEKEAEAVIKDLVEKGEPHLKVTRHYNEHGERIFYGW